MSMDAGHEPQTKRRKLNGNAAIAKKQEIIKPLPLPTQANTADAEEPEEKTLEVKMNDAGMSDAEYFASRLKRKLGDHLEPEAEEQQPTEDTADAKDEAESEEKEEHNDITKSILHTGRLFIRNLAYHATSDQIQSHFSPFGTCSLHLPADQERSSTGVAYVHFQDPQDAVKAHQALDGRPFLGRLIHVLPSVDRFAPAQPAKFVADPKKKSKSEQDHGQQSGATLVTNVRCRHSSLPGLCPCSSPMKADGSLSKLTDGCCSSLSCVSPWSRQTRHHRRHAIFIRRQARLGRDQPARRDPAVLLCARHQLGRAVGGWSEVQNRSAAQELAFGHHIDHAPELGGPVRTGQEARCAAFSNVGLHRLR